MIGVIFIIALALSSCIQYYDEDNTVFYVRNDGADMPVWVRGNTDSGEFIILMAGWPGAGALYPISEAFKRLEGDYAVVYWDCRGSGNVKGNPPESTFTFDQLVDDTNVIIDVIDHRYDNPVKYMMAHSFGGLLGSFYLQNPVYQAKIAGWIDVEGAVNNPGLMDIHRDNVINYAQKHQDDEYWKEALDWAQKNPEFSLDNLGKYAQYAFEAGFVTYKPGETMEDIVAYTFNAPVGALENYTGMAYLGEVLKFPYEHKYYMPPSELANITIPSLVIKGNYKWGGMGDTLGQMEFDALGTDDSQKTYVYFDKSGHSPYANELERFYNAVRTFTEGL